MLFQAKEMAESQQMETENDKIKIENHKIKSENHDLQILCRALIVYTDKLETEGRQRGMQILRIPGKSINTE